MLERLYGSLDALKQKEVYLVEAPTGFSLGTPAPRTERVLCRKSSLKQRPTSVTFHQDLCESTPSKYQSGSSALQ